MLSVTYFKFLSLSLPELLWIMFCAWNVMAFRIEPQQFHRECHWMIVHVWDIMNGLLLTEKRAGSQVD